MQIEKIPRTHGAVMGWRVMFGKIVSKVVGAATPVYEELEGWETDLRDVRDVDDLPPTARRYVLRIESLLGIDCNLLSLGPARAETIMLKNPFR